MATITADVSSTQERIMVSAMPNLDYFQIDDEIFHVIVQRPQSNKLLVERGYAGTTAATHLSGADLEPVYVPSAGGGVQTIRLITMAIEEDTAGITSTPGAVIGELPAGTTALMCSVALSGDWTATDEDVVPLNVHVELSLGPDVMMGLFAVSDIAGDSGALGDLYSAFTQPAQAFWANQSVINTGAARNIRAFVNNASGFPTPARADIYVLIAEPA